MRIPLFCGDAGRSLLIRTVQILGYLITKEIYSGLTQNITKVAVIHELPDNLQPALDEVFHVCS